MADLARERQINAVKIYALKKHLGFLNLLVRSPLPKSGYSKRKNGIKVKQRNNQEPKAIKYLKKQMQVSIELQNLYTEREELKKNYKIKGSIKDIISDSSNRPLTDTGRVGTA